MSTATHGLNTATMAPTAENLRLVGKLLRAEITDPGHPDDIPAGATLVLLPDDDPARTETNLGTRIAAARAG